MAGDEINNVPAGAAQDAAFSEKVSSEEEVTSPGPRIRDEENFREKRDSSPEIQGAESDSDSYDVRKEDHFGEAEVIHDAKALVTHVLHVDDDPNLSPYTFRSLFLGA